MEKTQKKKHAQPETANAKIPTTEAVTMGKKDGQNETKRTAHHQKEPTEAESKPPGKNPEATKNGTQNRRLRRNHAQI